MYELLRVLEKCGDLQVYMGNQVGRINTKLGTKCEILKIAMTFCGLFLEILMKFCVPTKRRVAMLDLKDICRISEML